jgi:phosphoribosylformimino-5-aminoimidazole carboxamide ribotide isomerase
VLFIPAIDIIGGRCVRLRQGDYGKPTEYSEDPVDTAIRFREHGAEFLHVVDLDAARDGGRGNIRTIKRIISSAGVPVQVGGGVRGKSRASELLLAGASRVILGTVIAKDPSLVEEMLREFGERLVAGIDARGGTVRISGWREGTGVEAVELGRRVREMGFSLIVYTDIEADGMLEGPNLAETEKMAQETGLPVIAAGGITNIEDVRALLKLENRGVVGMISGRAIYEGTLSVGEACRVARGGA